MPVSNLFAHASQYLDNYLPKNEHSKNIIKKIGIGVFIFIIASFVIILPLLSSAEPDFAAYINNFISWAKTIISFTFFVKIVFFILLGIALFAGISEWKKEFEFTLKKKEFKMDAIISGIVLGGILALYLLFLTTQLKYFGLQSLPLAFKETETLVKNGFWQLFFLSGLNVFLFFLYYRNTVKSVQNILIAFTFASLLLLISAGQRMFLYVTLYGFSYEKFFASYTVIYSLILFVFLIICLFKKEHSDIFKFLIVSFIWMYSVSTILPVERFIFQANTALSQKQDSRIDLYELKILSNDVLGLVQNYKTDTNWQNQWRDWIKKQQERSSAKKWYEKNIVNLAEK